MLRKYFFMLLGLLLQLGAGYNNDEVVLLDDTGPVELGTGWNSISEKFANKCISLKRNPREGSSEHAHLNLEGRITYNDLKTELGLEANTRVALQAGTLKGLAKFAYDAQDSEYSISLVLAFGNKSKSYAMDTSRGAYEIVGDRFNFGQRCGDNFVHTIIKGGKLFLLYKINFVSVQQKTKFLAEVGADFHSGQLNEKFTKAATRLGGDLKITINAYQVGGVSSELLTILGQGLMKEFSTPTIANSVALFSRALDYANNSFKNQIQNRPTDVYYLIKPWSVLGIGTEPRRAPQEVQQARQVLREAIDKHLKMRSEIEQLNYDGIVTSQLAYYKKIHRGLMDRINRNLSILIGESINLCFDRLADLNINSKIRRSAFEEANIQACVNAAQLKALNLIAETELAVKDIHRILFKNGQYQVPVWDKRKCADISPIVVPIGGFLKVKFARYDTKMVSADGQIGFSLSYTGTDIWAGDVENHELVSNAGSTILWKNNLDHPAWVELWLSTPGITNFSASVIDLEVQVWPSE